MNHRKNSGKILFKQWTKQINRGDPHEPSNISRGFFQIQGPYTLSVGFDDDTEQVIDFLPTLEGELFGPLRNRSLFNQVRIDPEIHTLVWPNGADFDPATLHDWPEHLPELKKMAKCWSLAKTA